MKNNKSILSALPTGIVCCVAVLASLCCMITAFDFPVDNRLCIGISAAACLVWMLAFRLPHRKIILPFLLLGCGILVYYYRAPIAIGARTVANTLIANWSDCYAWCPDITLPDLGGTAEVTAVFALLGAAATVLSLFGILQCNSCLLSVVVTLPFFLISVSLVNHPPAVPALLCLIGALLLLVLTQAVRSVSPARGNRLGWLLVIPVALFCLLLTVLAPQEDYQRSNFSNWLLELFSGQTFDSYVNKGNEVYQSKSAPKSIHTDQSVYFPMLDSLRQDPSVVMEVTAQHDGTLYLRGTSLGNYRSNSWSQTESWAPPSNQIQASISATPDGDADQQSGITNYFTAAAVSFNPLVYADCFLAFAVTKERVSLHMTASHDVIYLPYYAQNLPDVSAYTLNNDSYIENSGEIQDYEVNIYVPQRDTIAQCSAGLAGSLSSGEVANWQHDAVDAHQEYDAYAHQVYTQLPDDTQQAMLELVEQNSIGGDDVEAIAASVADFYQTNGRYTVVPAQMPEGEDFAVWFTADSMAGYCVHFATSATVMLRAMGVPARYTTGYVVTAKANETVNVTGLNAHAWVEYYMDGFGWIPLEVTPSGSNAAGTPDATKPTQPQSDAATPQTPSEITPAGDASGTSALVGHWWYWLLLAPVALVLGIVLRRQMVLLVRRRRMASASSEKQAEMLWYQALRACRKSGLPLQEDMEQIALKAKYSNHKLTNLELAALRDYCQNYLQQVYAVLSPAKRLWARWVFIL